MSRKEELLELLKDGLTVELTKVHGWFGAVSLAVTINFNGEEVCTSEVSIEDGTNQ